MFFDLDGTLIDIHGPLFLAARRVLREFGHQPELTRERYDQALKSGDLWFGVPAEKRADYVRLAFTYFMVEIDKSERLEVLPYVAETLAEIKRRGYKTAVITSRPGDSQILMRKLAAAKIADYFDQVVTQPVSEMKALLDKTEILRQTAAHAVVSPLACLYVGDEPRDIMAASQAGYAASVAVATGTASAEYLRNHENFKPDYVIDAMNELVPLLDRIAMEAH